MTVYLEGEGVCMTVDPAEETLRDAEDSCRTIAGEEPAVAFVPEARKSCRTGGKGRQAPDDFLGQVKPYIVVQGGGEEILTITHIIGHNRVGLGSNKTGQWKFLHIWFISCLCKGSNFSLCLFVCACPL